jgi:hypothetical protein
MCGATWDVRFGPIADICEIAFGTKRPSSGRSLCQARQGQSSSNGIAGSMPVLEAHPTTTSVATITTPRLRPPTLALGTIREIGRMGSGALSLAHATASILNLPLIHPVRLLKARGRWFIRSRAVLNVFRSCPVELVVQLITPFGILPRSFLISRRNRAHRRLRRRWRTIRAVSLPPPRLRTRH